MASVLIGRIKLLKELDAEIKYNLEKMGYIEPHNSYEIVEYECIQKHPLTKEVIHRTTIPQHQYNELPEEDKGLFVKKESHELKKYHESLSEYNAEYNNTYHREYSSTIKLNEIESVNDIKEIFRRVLKIDYNELSVNELVLIENSLLQFVRDKG